MTLHNSDTAIELRLQSFIQRIEKLVDERDTITTDIGEVYKEAKSAGLEPRFMREVVKLRAMDPDKRAYQDEMLAIYRKASGL